MRGIFQQAWIGTILATFGVLFGGSLLSAQPHGTAIPIDMPVSLAVGQVKTPEFKTKNGMYGIMVRVKRSLPPDTINCMLGVVFVQRDPKCIKEPILRANWTLWSDGQIVKQGSTNDQRNGGRWAYDSVDRIIGGFRGEKGRKYILEVNFTANGTALDATDPHLIVQLSND